MTIEEFNNTKWRANMKASYMYEIYKICSVNFQEYLICLDDDESLIWARCENVELVND